ncbi:hypothetical protein KBZ16_13765, partial [Vulcanococcus limneticus Candia 3B3]
RYMWKTLVGNLAVTGRFAHILPAEAAQIHCGAEDLVFLRRPQVMNRLRNDQETAVGVAAARRATNRRF